MEMRNWEDWALGLTFVAAAALAVTLSEARSPSYMMAAIAGERSGPVDVITVTAKRLPAECKGLSASTMTAKCAALIDNATISVTETRRSH
jgi:hypothetical protein